jgi:glycosyltransferase involved in cell wall biosynthesis
MTSNIKKIAVVIPKYGLLGGAEKFVSELTERVALNERYDIHVFANKWHSLSDRVTFHKVPVIIFPKFLTTISFAYFAGLKISKMKFDLIHSHDRIFDADIFTMHGIPHRVWVHEVRKKHMSLFDYGTSWVEKSLANNRRCERFLSVSNMTKEIFLQEHGIAQRLGIENDVIFAGIQKENLEQIYLACDIFSMLSKFDTFGMTVLEAMAASLPVIISSNVGAKDLVGEGINGFVIKDTTNADMICDRIGSMLNNKTRIRMAKEAYNTALNNKWDAVAKRMEDIYEEMLQT